MEERSEESETKHSQMKGVRRERQAARVRRNQPARAGSEPVIRRVRERNIVVRAQLREQPDVRKIARAVIQLATAEAEQTGLENRDA